MAESFTRSRHVVPMIDGFPSSTLVFPHRNTVTAVSKLPIVNMCMLVNITLGLCPLPPSKPEIMHIYLFCLCHLLSVITAGGSGKPVWGRLTSVAGCTVGQSIIEKCVVGRCCRSCHKPFVLTCKE